MAFYTYIVCSRRNGTLYTGHTDDLLVRIWQHRNNIFPGFASKYNCKYLVWFDQHETRDSAFTRERQIKEWKRDLIETDNPQWQDLYEDLTSWTPVSATQPLVR